MKFVINRCFGGFNLSKKGYEFLGLNDDNDGYIKLSKMERYDPKLVKCVETLGRDASGKCSKLVVIDVPIEDIYYVSDHDGMEELGFYGRKYSY